ncbi:MAG: TldD/PmbA family protein [Acidobacteriota bacterium]
MPLESFAIDIVARARKLGADFADSVVIESTDFSSVYRMGKVEKLVESTSRAMGLRVIRGGRTAITYTSDFAPERIGAFVAGGIELLAYASVDEVSSVPEAEMLGSAAADLGLYDPEIEAMTAEEKIAVARKTEEAVFAADKRVNNTEGNEFASSLITFALANSEGFAGGYRKSVASISASAVLDDTQPSKGENVRGKKQSDGWYTVGTSLKALETPEAVGRRAAERTTRLIGSTKVATKEVPVVFEQPVASQFMGSVFQAISGAGVWRKQSFLAEALGQQIGSELFKVCDDPLMPGHIGSRPFDGEGVRARRNLVFDGGKLASFLLDTYSSRKLKLKTTGSASRSVAGRPSPGATNFFLMPGTVTPEEIVASVKNGLMVVSLMGFGVNIVNGVLSQGIQGIWIENGKLTRPVSEMTIAGNLRDMLASIDTVGNDLVFRGSMAAPTFRIAKMAVSGT